MIRRLTTRYLFVLAAVALLVVIDQVIVQPLLIRLDHFAPAINLSGRQRMLSQRLTKASLAIERGGTAASIAASQAELRTTVRQWAAAHVALRDGNAAGGIRRISSPEMVRQWNQIEPHFIAMTEAADLLSDDSVAGSRTAIHRAAVATIIAHEAAFLEMMERIVQLIEQEAAREVWRLRSLALLIAGAIITLLAGVGWFVVRPATSTIRQQMDLLEARVAQRTAELAAALGAVQAEIVEREKIELKNQRLAAQLAHADRMESIGRLATGLAHELNQPLGAIANYAEACDVILRRDATAAEQKLPGFVAHIRQAALRAGQIVRRIRNYVKPNAGEFTDVDLRSLVEEIVALCRAEIDSQRVALEIDQTAEPMIARVDVIQVQQVLVNLIQNALQAMAPVALDSRQLLIRVARMDTQVRVDVVDGGPGFRLDDLDHRDAIFESFYSSKPEGLGVGLAICRAIMDDHHGEIWAANRPDRQGGMVSFTLPLASSNAIRHPQLDRLCR